MPDEKNKQIILDDEFEKLLSKYNYSIENDVLSLSLLKTFIKGRDETLHLMRLHQLNLPIDIGFVDNIAINALSISNELLSGDRNRDLKCCENQIMNLNYAIANTSSSLKYLKILIKYRDMWNSLKIRKIRKTTGINGIFFKINRLFYLGTKFHEYSHHVSCKLIGVKSTLEESFDDSLDIIDLKRRFPYKHDNLYCFDDNICGYTNHEEVYGYHNRFFISYSPFIFGTITATGLFYLSFIINGFPLLILTFFLGISISYNAFPSKVDDNVIMDNLKFIETRTFFKNAFNNKEFIIISTLPILRFVSIFRDKIYLIRSYIRYPFGGFIYPIFLFLMSFLIIHGLSFVIIFFILIFYIHTTYTIYRFTMKEN